MDFCLLKKMQKNTYLDEQTSPEMLNIESGIELNQSLGFLLRVTPYFYC